jgi:hypothetical protein
MCLLFRMKRSSHADRTTNRGYLKFECCCLTELVCIYFHMQLYTHRHICSVECETRFNV